MHIWTQERPPLSCCWSILKRLHITTHIAPTHFSVRRPQAGAQISHDASPRSSCCDSLNSVGITQNSCVLWVLLRDENGMPGSTGEHLVLMSRESRGHSQISSHLLLFFPLLLLSLTLSLSVRKSQLLLARSTFLAVELSSSLLNSTI